MKRILEPELMIAPEQALAYASADFAAPHGSYVILFANKFPRCSKSARVLDLGCGPCDVTIRFAKAKPGWRFDAVDGSPAMLKHAHMALSRERALSRRIRLIEGLIPGATIPKKTYDVIISSSFLHHLHDPQVLWRTIRQHSRRGTLVFIADLRRPTSRSRAREFERKYSGNEPEILRRDFFNSLLAAFTPAEVRRQLKSAGLAELKVEIISDRHLIVFGKIS